MSTAKPASSSAKSSAKSAKVAAPEPVAPPAAPVVAPVADVKEKAPRAKKAAAAAAPSPAPEPVAAPVATAAPATASATTDGGAGVTLLSTITDLHDQLSAIKAALSTAASAVKLVEKQAASLVKKSEKKNRKHKNDAAPGASARACIFTKEVKISPELCSFLGKAKDTPVSRAVVTKEVVAYAKSHNLMDKQSIKPDAALRKLLSLNEADTLSILSLQKYLKNHYVKTPAVPVPAPVA